MLEGFRDFVVRGNVVDLAVAFVMGVAFATVVTQFTESFLQPLIKLASGGEGLAAGTWRVRDIVFNWSAFVNDVIAFLLTAAVLLLTEIRDLLAAGRVPRQGLATEQRPTTDR